MQFAPFMGLNYDHIYMLLGRQIMRYNDAKILTLWLSEYSSTSNIILKIDET